METSIKQCLSLYILFVAMVSIFLTSTVFAQTGETPIGAKARSMGNAVVSVADVWSAFNNVAGIAEIDKQTILFSFDNRYQLTAFNTVAIGFIMPFKASGLSFSAERFGNNTFNNISISVGFAHKIGGVSIGLKANYLQYAFEGLKTKGVPTFEFGVLTRLSKDFVLGTHVYNVHRAKLSNFQDERIPTIIKLGISYKPNDKLMFNMETEKDIEFDPIFRIGLEYQPVNKLYARIGIETKSKLNFFGFGYQLRKFNIDYAVSSHPQLGLSHHLSVAFNVKTVKKMNIDHK